MTNRLIMAIFYLSSALASASAQQRPASVMKPAAAPPSAATPAPAMPIQQASQQRGQVVTNITNRILETQQIIYFTPQTKRTDIAEAIRKALTQRGSEVILITDRNNFWTTNSLTLRMMYMGASTYDIKSTAKPFLILDGVLYSGPGLAGGGQITTDPTHQKTVVAWTNSFLQAHKPLVRNDQTAEWIRRAQLGPKESDLPPKTPDPAIFR